jgi:hypothetical protein
MPVVSPLQAGTAASPMSEGVQLQLDDYLRRRDRASKALEVRAFHTSLCLLIIH